MVTHEALQTFYEAHVPAKASEASAVAEKYAMKTAQLMRVCKSTYGSAPEHSSRSDITKSKRRPLDAEKPKTTTLADYQLEELELELSRRKGGQTTQGASQGTAAGEDEDEFPFQAAADVAGDHVHKVVIIGGGPAGLAAATYTARAGLRPVVVAPAFGGQLLGKGVDVENYPGVVGEHATGRGIVELMRRQAHSFEARFIDSEVVEVDFSSSPLRIRANGTEKEILTHSVILASGASSRWLHAAGEHDFRGRGVSACATCDGFLFRGKDVIVVGGGDHAMEDALNLARTSSQVTVVHRGAKFRASKVLADRVLGHASIRVKWNTTVRSFHGGDGLTHVVLQSNAGSAIAESTLKADGAFVAIGHIPATDFLHGNVELDSDGYVVLHKGTSTSARGVFAAGDVADRTYRQAATAGGSGVMAALDVERFLNEL